MLTRRVLPFMLPLVGLAACGEDEPSTGPTAASAPAAAVVAAGQLVVNSLADPGDGACTAAQCTLREAIRDASATAIVFAPGLSGAITLASPAKGGGTLLIGRSLTITGPTAGITVRRRPTDPAYRIVKVIAGTTVGLSRLTLRNGKVDNAGGGILTYGTLTLTDCTIAGNAAALHGGGIDNHGPLTLVRTAVANNAGGGLDNHDMAVTLTNSSVMRNTGTGVSNKSGGLTVTGGTIAYNTGGGLTQDWGRTRLDRVRVVGNSTPGSGGGISGHQGTITLTNSTVARNTAARGGGIATSQLDLTLTGTTVANNSATEYGGGIYSRSWVRSRYSTTLTNSTVSGNSAAYGGGILLEDDYEAGGSGTFVSTTVAFNSASAAGGGIYDISTGESGVGLTNSILAKNTAPAQPDLRLGESSIFGASFSLVGDGTGTGLANTGGNLVGNVTPYSAPIDPLLGPLADNGGPTTTHALLTGSPALDVATADGCPATDQRGVTRPQGPACDMGSFELEAAGR